MFNYSEGTVKYPDGTEKKIVSCTFSIFPIPQVTCPNTKLIGDGKEGK